MSDTRIGWKRPSRLVPLTVILLVIIGLTVYRVASRTGVKREIEAVRARGLPTAGLELDNWYRKVPATENAALAFLEANSYYVVPGTNNPSDNNKDKMVPGEPLPPVLAVQVKLLLSKNRETIEQLHLAAELTQSRYPIDLTRGFETLLPHLSQLKRLGQLLEWEAVQQSANGNKVAALKAIKSTFALASSLENEPIVISGLVRMAILQLALTAMERVMTEQNLTEAELERLSGLLARAEEQGKHSLRRSIVGERGIGIPGFEVDYRTFEALSGSGSGGFAADLPGFTKMMLYEARRKLGATDRDKAFYLRKMGEYEKTVDLDFPEMLTEARRIDADITAELGGHRIRYMISGLLLPSLYTAIQKVATNAAILRCARTAAAIERFRVKNGRIPAVQELVPDYLPAVPRDPVSGKPLIIEKLPKGYRVLAEGASELKIDGGKKGNETDVAFSVLK